MANCVCVCVIHVRLNFKTNVEKACEKAARVNMALSLRMSNTGGPSQSRRLLLAIIIGYQSIMMGAAPVWRPALGIRIYARAARSLFRLSALRFANDFRTVLYEAIGVISGITPPDVKAMELERLCGRVRIIGTTLTRI